jgi:hypothetical protein
MASTEDSKAMTHYWRVRKTLPDRWGQGCRILARGAGPGPRNICVEFEDRVRVVTHRHAVRRLPEGNGPRMNAD